MKTTIQNIMAVIFIAASLQTHAQGFMYDQQSATNPVAVVGNGNADGLDIQEDQPLVQSFIPSLSAIGFVQLEFADIGNYNGANGATVYVNLWTGRANVNLPPATLLGSTAPVYMPNGFENGFTYSGVTNFYFSTPVALTSGQTYYLQPVVASGDNPWDIVTIGDTYPNGQVFIKGAGFNTDFWFREGVTVPEPTFLALIGLGSLAILMCRRRTLLRAFAMLAVLFILLAASPIHAQQALAPVQDSVVQAVADEAELAPATALPKVGTFWVMTAGYNGNLTALPYPTLPANLSALPIYSVAGNAFIVDDTGGQLAPSSARRMNSVQAASTLQAQVQTVAGLIERIQMAGSDENNQAYQPNGFTSMIDTNGLWLEASNKVTSLGLRLHNTVGGDNYQLLFKTNLLIFVCRRCRNFPHGLIDNVTQGNFQGTGDPQQSVEVGNSHFALNVTDGLLRKACADTERRHRNAALHSLVLQNFADPRTNCLPIFL
jgi:hypothetical protein